MSQSENKNNYTVIVVDDEPINLTTISEILSSAGYRVLVTNRSRKAVNLIKSQSPDLVLLDIYMPGLNGLEICRMLKEDTKCKHIPVIFLTASDSDSKQGFACAIDGQYMLLRIDGVIRQIKSFT